MTTLILLAIIGFFVLNLAFGAYILAGHNVFFTRVPAGEIIVVVVSEKVKRFIGNIDGFWVHPQTGEVFDDKDTANPRPKNLPSDFFGTGIYWLGIWPLYERYHYEFHWNKYAKKKNEKGEDTSEYELIPKEGVADSVYFRAQYPIRMSGAETSENVPLSLDFLITTQTVNVDTALFKAKSPGWLASLTGSVTAGIRDFNGNKTTEEMIKLEAELPPVGSTGKTTLQGLIERLNNSSDGNPSIIEQFGQQIIAINFLSVSIDQPKTDVHRVAIAKYLASRTGEADIATAAAQAKVAEENAKATQTNADAEARAIAVVGKAKADAAAQFAEAVSKNPHAGTIAIAEAIQNQKHATTLIIGQGIVPTKAI